MKEKYVLLSLLFIFLFSSCDNLTYQTAEYNSQYNSYLIETNNYYILKKDEYYIYNKTTSEEYPLLDNPLDDNKEISKIKSIDNTIYYMYKNKNSQHIIESLNLDTGDRKNLYVDSTYGKNISLFDIEIDRQSALQYNNIGYELIDFMILKGDLILVRRDMISRIQNNKEILIYEGHYEKMTNDSEYLYFTNEKYNLCSLNIETKEKKEYSTIKPSQFFLYDNLIYYISQANYSFSIFDIKSNKILYESDGNWNSIFFTKGKCILKNKDNNLFYLTKNLSFKKLEIDYSYDDLLITKNGNKLIAFNYDRMDFQQLNFINLNIQ